MIKKLLALLLACVMLVGMLAGCGNTNQNEQPDATDGGNAAEGTTGEEQAAFPEWLHPGSLPIVEEGTEKTLRIATILGANSGEPEDTWFYRYAEEVMNINLEVEYFTADNQSEYLTLMFADGDLPDIIISSGYFTAPQLVKYGAKEGQLLDLAPYINEQNTPNLYKIYQENPEYKTPVTDAEGHVWSLAQIAPSNEKGQITRAFLNYDWLEEAGLEVPTTLEEFTNVLREFKKRGDDIYPLGGGVNRLNPCNYILTALGYVTGDRNGLAICLRDGEVVLPAADKEVWPEFLEIMHTYYEEGLIHPDFYTMDKDTIKALAASDKFGFIVEAPFVYTQNYSQYWGATPLTSEFNDTPVWPAANSVKAGNFVVSADCENPELALAFADWFFEVTEEPMYGNYLMYLNGPTTDQTDILLGLEGCTVDPETGARTYLDYEKMKDSYASKNDYLADKVHLWSSGYLGWVDATKIGYSHLDTVEDLAAIRDTYVSGEVHFRTAMYDTLVPYVTTTYPYYVYFDAEKTSELAEIQLAFTDYIMQETAKFVTGATPITEENLEKYFAELEKLGVYDYIQAYADFYNSIN